MSSVFPFHLKACLEVFNFSYFDLGVTSRDLAMTYTAFLISGR